MKFENDNDVEQKYCYLEESAVKKIETIIKIINDFQERTKNYSKQIKYTGKLRNSSEQTVIQEQGQAVITRNDDANELEQLMLNLKQLETKESGLKQDIANMELKLSNAKKIESEKMDAQNKAVQNYRDLYKASKQLTKTTFNYQSSNVTGAIVNKQEPIQVFNLNQKKLNAENLTKHLWKYMCLASGENWSAIISKN